MEKNLLTAIWFTLVTTVIFSVIYSTGRDRLGTNAFSQSSERTTH